jgi:tRNA(Ile)-lysidine synthase TilS/MesJ
MAVGNKHLGYKDALNAIEERSPGTKAAFYGGFLERATELVAHAGDQDREGLHPCPSCGAPTTSPLCAFCRLVARAGDKQRRRADRPVPADQPVSGS